MPCAWDRQFLTVDTLLPSKHTPFSDSLEDKAFFLAYSHYCYNFG